MTDHTVPLVDNGAPFVYAGSRTNHPPTERTIAMPIFNVLTAVVELIEADSEQEAIAALHTRLRASGFDTYDAGDAGDQYTVPHAFESEPLTDDVVGIVRAEARTWAAFLGGAK